MNPTALIINPRVRLILFLAAAAGCEAAALAADGPRRRLAGQTRCRVRAGQPRNCATWNCPTAHRTSPTG